MAVATPVVALMVGSLKERSQSKRGVEAGDGD
jgi:hypothetical protein